MDLSCLSPAPGTRKDKKRVGRGPGSGYGKTCGRGHKGQGARSGGGTKAGFEGGQMPLKRRVPKRGFHNPFRIRFAVVHVGWLNRFEADSEITPEVLRQQGMVGRQPVKVLGDGEISKAVTLRVHGCSRGARQKIEAAGGRIELLPHA